MIPEGLNLIEQLSTLSLSHLSVSQAELIRTLDHNFYFNWIFNYRDGHLRMESLKAKEPWRSLKKSRDTGKTKTHKIQSQNTAVLFVRHKTNRGYYKLHFVET